MSNFSSALSVKITRDTKLRNLPLKEINKLINILNRNNCWKELAGIITHPDNTNELLFSADNIGTLEMEWKRGSSPAEAMLQHWSTYGKEQPNISDLIKFLKNAGLLRAVTDVMKNLLQIDDDNDIETNSVKVVSNTFRNEVTDCAEVDLIAEALTDVNLEGLAVFSYNDLRNATKNFCDMKAEEGGCKIGEGTYGTVYRAVISDVIVAVKRLKDPVDKQFVTELDILTKYRHENLLPLLGCSLNGPYCCLVYDYMVNGSLQERLACLNTEPLSWTTRMSIAYGSALGINHLHTYGEDPMVHRDIKSANILLDENFIPKVGDFGLVRVGDSSNSTTMPVTENVFGTCVYMAREAFYGDVSVKLDTFSFGVVLLELLTGLSPYDAAREDRDLVTFIQNNDNILNILDPKAGWCSSAGHLFDIAKLCLTESKKARPTISEKYQAAYQKHNTLNFEHSLKLLKKLKEP